MRIHIRLAEPFWRTVGKREFSLELTKGACVKELISELRECYPDLAKEMEEISLVIFVGEEEARHDTRLEDDDHVHLVWPIAGG
jgi:molybdopterin converting factor small subunit